ncbi:MAG TPA: FadR/GntR family transcriptional regulator [Caldilineaceae bacterium]|nr:FadR/GntR family transcriptional regulator [Caldilineaceae bacterium]
MKTQAVDSLFGTFKKSSISEDIVANLLSLIRERELRPGDKLPPERELAAMMQVSRPSLREALRALAIMNIIEIRQGDGTYVTSLEPKLLMAHLDFVFALTDATFLELFEARRILEPGIVAIAATRITDEEIAALEACVARSIDLVDDHEAFAQADLEMHERIAKAAGNTILERFMASLSQLGKESRRRTVALPGVTRQSVQDHLAIVAALKQRDPAAAQAAMLDHLRHVERELKQLTPRGAG